MARVILMPDPVPMRPRAGRRRSCGYPGPRRDPGVFARILGRWARATIMPPRSAAAVEGHSSLRAASCA